MELFIDPFFGYHISISSFDTSKIPSTRKNTLNESDSELILHHGLNKMTYCASFLLQRPSAGTVVEGWSIEGALVLASRASPAGDGTALITLFTRHTGSSPRARRH